MSKKTSEKKIHNTIPIFPGIEKLNIIQNYWINRLKNLGYPDNYKFNFHVNSWGSCQYSSAQSIYDLYFKIREDLSVHDTLTILGIQIQYDGINSDSEFHSTNFFSEFVKTYYEDRNKKYFEKNKKMIWSKEDIERYIKLARRCQSWDDVFYTFRQMAWDLWTAAPMACQLAFENFKIQKAPKSPGFGPCGNVQVQSTNFVTGICCALLKDSNLVKNEKSFSGFDT
jgi:hypothetical protein